MQRVVISVALSFLITLGTAMNVSAQTGGDRHSSKADNYVRPKQGSSTVADGRSNRRAEGNSKVSSGQGGVRNPDAGGYSVDPAQESIASFMSRAGRPSIQASAAQRLHRQGQPAKSPAHPLTREERDQKMKEYSISVLQEMGIDLAWDVYTREELRLIILKARKAAELKKLGSNVSWHTHDLDELDSELLRVKTMKALEEQGIFPEVGKTELAEVLDLENRVKQSARLYKLGIRADWRKKSLAELKQMEKNYYALRPRH